MAEVNKKYRLDKTTLKPMTFEEADDHISYWNDKTESERLNAACFIINNIFQVDPKTKLDTNIADKRKQF